MENLFFRAVSRTRSKKSEKEAVRTEILSGRLVVIEMAFAAVYLVVHADPHWQKGFSRGGWKFSRNVGIQTKNVARKEWQNER